MIFLYQTIKYGMKGNIITLTTDWGDSDNYAAIFKGHLYCQSPDLKIVDVTHRVQKARILDAAFLAKTMYHYYPKNTVHIIDVGFISNENLKKYHDAAKAGLKTDDLPFTHYLAFRYDDHYFLCENNGLITLFCDVEEITEIVQLLPDVNYDIFQTFKAIPYSISAATKLSQGKPLHEVGTPYNIDMIQQLKRTVAYVSPMNKDAIVFTAQYIDSYENIITNLHKDLFDAVAKERTFFTVQSSLLEKKERFKISQDYLGSSLNETVFLFGHSNYLEIATRHSPLGKILKGGLMSTQFTINFLD